MNHHPATLKIGSFASGQAEDVVTPTIVGSFAHGQADGPAPVAREGSFATGQAFAEPESRPIGRFCTGQERGDVRRIRPGVAIDPRRTAEASVAD